MPFMYIMWFRSYSISLFCLSICFFVFLSFFFCRYFILRTGRWPLIPICYVSIYFITINLLSSNECQRFSIVYWHNSRCRTVMSSFEPYSMTKVYQSNLPTLHSSLSCVVYTCHRSSGLIIAVVGLSFSFSYDCIFE